MCSFFKKSKLTNPNKDMLKATCAFITQSNIFPFCNLSETNLVFFSVILHYSTDNKLEFNQSIRYLHVLCLPISTN